MAPRTNIALTPKDRFLQAAIEEFEKFEADEREFRKRDREERAKRLHLPLDVAVH